VTRILATLLLLSALFARAAEAPVSFKKDIAPILVAKCLACHNAEKAKGSYRLHTFDALMKPGSSEDAPVVAGNAAESTLFQLITAKDEDDRMPQKDEPLTPAQIAAIRTWIEHGAKFDGEDRNTALAVLSPPQHRSAPKSYPVAVPITALAFDASGECIAASGYHEITVWNSRSGELVQRIGNIAERVFDLAFSPDGRWLACASGTPGKIGEVKLLDATNGALIKALATTADAVLSVAFAPDGAKLAAGGTDNAIRIWTVDTDKPPLTIEQHADWVLALAFNPDGTRLASGSRDKTSRLFDTATGELDETYNGHSDFVTAATWPDAKSVISVSRTRTAHRWNVKDSKKSSDFSGWDGDITRLIVAGTNLFSASLDRRVRVHDLESKALTLTFDAHNDAIHSLAFHAATKRLASGSHNGEVRVWNAEDGKLLVKFMAVPGFAPKLSRTE
jgi:WD40 repeat protein